MKRPLYLFLVGLLAVIGLTLAGDVRGGAAGASASASARRGDQVIAFNATLQDAAAATGNGTAMNVGGLPYIAVQVKGSFTATVSFEGTLDGSTWVAVALTPAGGGAAVTSTTAPGIWTGSIAGYDQFRARATWTSGTSVTVLAKATVHPGTSAASAGGGGAVTQSGTWTVQPGNTANTTAWLVTGTGGTFPVTGTITANAGTGTFLSQPQAGTTGGATAYSYIATGAANQDAQAIDASPGTLYSIAAFNVNAAARYLKVYNTASPTSASTPVLRYLLPPSNSGVAINVPVGVAFSTAIGIRLTTGQADNDATAVTSGDCIVSAAYK